MQFLLFLKHIALVIFAGFATLGGGYLLARLGLPVPLVVVVGLGAGIAWGRFAYRRFMQNPDTSGMRHIIPWFISMTLFFSLLAIEVVLSKRATPGDRWFAYAFAIFAAYPATTLILLTPYLWANRPQKRRRARR